MDEGALFAVVFSGEEGVASVESFFRSPSEDLGPAMAFAPSCLSCVSTALGAGEGPAFDVGVRLLALVEEETTGLGTLVEVKYRLLPPEPEEKNEE